MHAPHPQAAIAPLAGAGDVGVAQVVAGTVPAPGMNAPPHKGEEVGTRDADLPKSSNSNPNVPMLSIQAEVCNALANREKQIATAKAHYARNGWGLYELADGSFLASGFAGWPPKPLPDVQSAMRFLRRATGGAA